MSAINNIVGIDIGNDKCVVAIVKPKGIQILMNHDAKYEIPSVVSFTKKKRQIGTEKSSLAMMNPQSTITQIKRLIGQNFDEPGMAEELKLLPFKTSKAEDGGIAIHIDYLGTEQTFTPVQILAMLLYHLKQMIEQNNADLPVSDCVISVPSYFNDLQRVAYLNAAEIAGLNPLRLMNDGTAIALGYGYFKRELDSPVNVVFVDVGDSDTQVTVAQFDREGVTILAHAFDRNLGGRDFDRVLYSHFLNDFNTKYKINIGSNPRATIRLMSVCEKAKTVLTTNREANISIDCLVNDVGVDGSIERDYFDELSTQLLNRLRTTLAIALTDAKLENAQINSVELAGSGSRIPAISNVVRDIFGMVPSRTLNGSDCVARGCALQCSLLRRSTGSNDYEVQDSIPFYVGFSSRSRFCEMSEDEKNQNTKISKTGNFNVRPGSSISSTKKTTSSSDGEANSLSNQYGTHQFSSMLFKKGQHIPSKEIVEFFEASQDQEFQFSIFYLYNKNGSTATPCASQKSRTFKVDNIKTGLNKSVRVIVKIDLHGMVVIAAAAQPNPDKQEITLAKLRCYEMLPIGMSKANIAEAQKREIDLLQRDKDAEDVLHQKNDLETFFYSTRKEFQLNGRYEEYAKKFEKERILKKLDALEPWLSENDDHEKEPGIYAEQLRALKELVNPVESRYKYFMDCIEATKELDVSIAELDRYGNSKIVGYYNYYSGWIGAVKQLQKIFPKDVEQLSVLLEKIKLMTALTTEERCHLTERCEMEDSHQTIERSVRLFRDANKYSLFEYQEGDTKKKGMWSLIHEICTRLSYLLPTTAPNSSFAADEFSTETIEFLLQDLKQEESKDEPDASSSELKREQHDRISGRTPEEKHLINSMISGIWLQLSERYGDFVPQLEKEEIDKKLHDIKNCLLFGDDELFHHKNFEFRKLLACIEENYMKEEITGQQRARLLYMIFDSRVKIMCIASYKSDMARYQQFDSLVKLANKICDNVEKKFEEVKSEDTLRCEKEYKILKRLQEEIQRFEDTAIGESKTKATLYLEERLLDIEKKVFGRYRYVVAPDEKKYISEIIKEIRGSLQRKEIGPAFSIWSREKEKMEKVMSTFEGRYERKNSTVQAAAKLCDCIFDHLITAQSKTLSSFNASFIEQLCIYDLKWLDGIYESQNITTGEIKKRQELLDAYCKQIKRDDFQTKSQRNDGGTATSDNTRKFENFKAFLRKIRKTDSHSHPE